MISSITKQYRGRLEYLRKKDPNRGLSYRAISEIIVTGKAWVSDFFRGNYTDIRVSSLHRLATALGCDVQVVLVPRERLSSPEYERIEVESYGEELFHLHGKSLSGLRHSHPLRPGENVDSPDHIHEGDDAWLTDSIWNDAVEVPDGVDRRGYGAALYPTKLE